MTIETNGFGAESQFMVMVGGPQNHWKTIEINGLGAESQFMVMVEGPKNHWKPLKAMVSGPKTLNGNGWVITKKHLSFLMDIRKYMTKGPFVPPQGKWGKGWKGLYFRVYLK